MFVLMISLKKNKKQRFSFIIKNHLDQNDLNEFLQCLRPRCRRGPSEFDTSWFRSWLPDGAPPSARPEPIKNHSTSQSRSFPGSLSSSILTSFHFHTALPRCLALIVLFFFHSVLQVKPSSHFAPAPTGFAGLYLEGPVYTFNDV